MIKVLIKGAGDLATGVAIALNRGGFDVVMTEIEAPTVIRRTVAFASAVYEGSIEVEGVSGVLTDANTYESVLEKGAVAVVVDPDGIILKSYQPSIVIDSILAKRNLGTKIDDGPIVIALGPGFEAGVDCHCVIETKRGHHLGQIITKGRTEPNTGIPGEIGGRSEERVIKAPCSGTLVWVKAIGDLVKAGDILLKVDDVPVKAIFDGCLRGLLMEGLWVKEGMKIGDVDPRGKASYCYTLSDKSRALGRAALEAALALGREKNLFTIGAIDG